MIPRRARTNPLGGKLGDLARSAYACITMRMDSLGERGIRQLNTRLAEKVRNIQEARRRR